ncbi:Leucine-rich repeat and coiled-coil domain containing protein [Dissostichus eleginoides]|uniref:Leucine-rich repeat and coiled-coil domain containing protein n=1 Tax=Dissostichus eleginoides TaxID=100907 RepID=A0AAD9ESK8_DISEL|nr:Leucine-rich repeat and coiled-coil domain containing protein [Dissostichus eleginoides]
MLTGARGCSCTSLIIHAAPETEVGSLLVFRRLSSSLSPGEQPPLPGLSSSLSPGEQRPPPPGNRKDRSTVSLGAAWPRWVALRAATGLQRDPELALLLLDHCEQVSSSSEFSFLSVSEGLSLMEDVFSSRASIVSELKGVPSDILQIKDNPGDSSEIKDNPGDSSEIKDNPRDSSEIKDNPGDSSEIKYNPRDSSEIKYNPRDSSEIKYNPGDSSEIKENPGDSSEIKYNPGDSSEIKDNPRDSSETEVSDGDWEDTGASVSQQKKKNELPVDIDYPETRGSETPPSEEVMDDRCDADKESFSYSGDVSRHMKIHKGQKRRVSEGNMEGAQVQLDSKDKDKV